MKKKNKHTCGIYKYKTDTISKTFEYWFFQYPTYLHNGQDEGNIRTPKTVMTREGLIVLEKLTLDKI